MAGRFGSRDHGDGDAVPRGPRASTSTARSELASHLLDTAATRSWWRARPASRRRSRYKEKAELFRAVGEAVRGPRQADLRHRHVLAPPRRSS